VLEIVANAQSDAIVPIVRLAALIEIVRRDRASVLALARDVSDDLDATAAPNDPDVIQLKPRH